MPWWPGLSEHPYLGTADMATSGVRMRAAHSSWSPSGTGMSSFRLDRGRSGMTSSPSSLDQLSRSGRDSIDHASSCRSLFWSMPAGTTPIGRSGLGGVLFVCDIGPETRRQVVSFTWLRAKDVPDSPGCLDGVASLSCHATRCRSTASEGYDRKQQVGWLISGICQRAVAGGGALGGGVSSFGSEPAGSAA
jgi:hypothetical protein